MEEVHLIFSIILRIGFLYFISMSIYAARKSIYTKAIWYALMSIIMIISEMANNGYVSD